jgi:hypothetical protein
MTQSAIIPDKYVNQLRRGGRDYARYQRKLSKKQWFFGALVNKVWDNLPVDMKEEIRVQDFYSECSQWINLDVPFVVCAATGETLRRWCEVAAHYETFPQVAAWREVLSFEHFRIAKSIGADPTNNLTSAEALAFAVENEWTADQMRDAFRTKQEANPAVIENRKRFAAWLGRVPDVLLGLNGNRKQAEYHLGEFVKLVETDKK